MRKRLDKELDALYDERQLMYLGDKEILDKIFDIYCPLIKKHFADIKTNHQSG